MDSPDWKAVISQLYDVFIKGQRYRLFVCLISVSGD